MFGYLNFGWMDGWIDERWEGEKVVLGDRCGGGGGGGGGGDRQYRQHSSYDRYRSSSIVKTLKDLF